MIGPLEIVILLAIFLLIFGYRWLPQIGRTSGKAVRTGTDKGRELATKATSKANEVDTKAIARQAGEHMRDVREIRDAVTGKPAGPTSAASSEKPPPAESAE